MRRRTLVPTAAPRHLWPVFLDPGAHKSPKSTGVIEFPLFYRPSCTKIVASRSRLESKTRLVPASVRNMRCSGAAGRYGRNTVAFESRPVHQLPSCGTRLARLEGRLARSAAQQCGVHQYCIKNTKRHVAGAAELL